MMTLLERFFLPIVQQKIDNKEAKASEVATATENERKVSLINALPYNFSYFKHRSFFAYSFIS
jgi:hypothetical protein